MALFKFVEAVEQGRPLEIYNEGRMERDFTYVGDLVEAIARLIPTIPVKGSPVGEPGLDSLSPIAPYRIVNIGTGRPVGLTTFVDVIEAAVGKPAIRKLMPMQPGDVPRTFASADLLEALTGYRPATGINAGVAAFVEWYRWWRSSGSQEFRLP
jgi:UDP-glucuronate 4-epimerase